MEKKKLNLEITEVGHMVENVKSVASLPGASGPCGPCGFQGIEGYEADVYAGNINSGNALGLSDIELKAVHVTAAVGVAASSEAGALGTIVGAIGFCGACHVAIALQ